MQSGRQRRILSRLLEEEDRCLRMAQDNCFQGFMSLFGAVPFARGLICAEYGLSHFELKDIIETSEREDWDLDALGVAGRPKLEDLGELEEEDED